MTTPEKLALLRTAMAEKGIDAIIVPDTDPHLNEYVTDHWRIIEWLTGFTGSAGIVIVTRNEALLWTDSRYVIQASQQLEGTGIVLKEPDLKDDNDYSGWLACNLEAGSKIGADGRLFATDKFRKLEQRLASAGLSLDRECDLLPGIWTERPPLPAARTYDFPVVYCGTDRTTKIAEVRKTMERQKADYHIISSPDDIMWMLNIRGNDLKYSPLMMCYAIVGMNQVLLFADEMKIPLQLAREFDRIGVVILPYEEAAGMVSTIEKDSSVIVSSSATPADLFFSIPENVHIIDHQSIPSLLKSVKNKIEIENLGKAMIKDGVALTKFFFWLEMNQGTSLTELLLTEKLDSLRLEQENCAGPSFATIVAFNEHAALPHYTAGKDSDSVISDGILLVDSGGQYFEGTTDITRTIALGKPTGRQSSDYTLVLKGMIDLAMAKFPVGTQGHHLDILARQPLWDNGLNFGHGTGHGVGFFLNVHEGPVSISPAKRHDNNVIRPGNLISNEPAIYRPGEYGIRTENLMLCYEDEETEFGRFFKFDILSLCYIDKNLINLTMLDSRQTVWLNGYHALVYDKLSPFLTKEEAAWLKKKTSDL